MRSLCRRLPHWTQEHLSKKRSIVPHSFWQRYVDLSGEGESITSMVNHESDGNMLLSKWLVSIQIQCLQYRIALENPTAVLVLGVENPQLDRKIDTINKYGFINNLFITTHYQYLQTGFTLVGGDKAPASLNRVTAGGGDERVEHVHLVGQEREDDDDKHATARARQQSHAAGTGQNYRLSSLVLFQGRWEISNRCELEVRRESCPEKQTITMAGELHEL